ncbi:phosphoesterase PA-phosphatase related [Acidimicrobium ferrooxidans DSM 10331]|uniref:Phosphoesterase PA-phosphatase related n=1 Tax=Acidimicrobium ferrooxidans (strain DSM 10331 / JCM 15462 / NBRC 103882 / ICP) TaxID=525909 RepID=C7LZN2_ACIFD|nr:phosphatase PAP2 family protein [Acidimicrobium ferrooxidans]ACU54190.1 phosphoesterase PA-phosphatase related [Acidimicrobium ferrooxidans DSM 10331]
MGELEHLNDEAYLDVNRIARETGWAHGAMAQYAHFVGVGVLAVVLLVAWWRARSRRQAPRAVAGVLWAAGGTVLAWVIAHYVLKPLVGERRPYVTLHHVEVLLARSGGYSFPSGHATVAGAVIVGLWLARDRLMAWIATIAGLLLAFGRVYVGVHYPGDVLAGLVLGGVVVWVGWRPAVGLLTAFDDFLLTRTPFAWLVESRRTSVGGGRA